MTMYVQKRNGKREPVAFDKVLRRIKALAFGLDSAVSVELVAQKTIEGIYDGIPTRELDILASEVAASKVIDHPDYDVLAARILISHLHKEVGKDIVQYAERLYHYRDPETGKRAPLISQELYQVIRQHTKEIENFLDYERDYLIDYFGIKTLEKTYLLRCDGEVAELPQHLFLRVAIGIHGDNMARVQETYDLLSQQYFTHATPTLITAGTPTPRLSSCFLVAMKDDSIEGIYETLKETALISQGGAGIGLHVHNIRAKGSYITGTGGRSNGLVPMLKVFNETARYVDQGGGKRKGAFAIYIEPWHADIFAVLDLKKNHGKEELRARDLFYAIWMPDLFMERVERDEQWSLFDPKITHDLSDLFGEAFRKKYEAYERSGKAVKTIRARDLWVKIIESQIETGVPYIVYKDAVNRRNQQAHLGVIKSSNLCAEIVEYSTPTETAVCNLASISLPRFVKNDSFDFEQLGSVVHVITRNLDRLIDINTYPVPETKRANLKQRPMGIGVQGLAYLFMELGLSFDSQEALKLNAAIFETIYYHALRESVALAKKYGPYHDFSKSPAAKGILQFDFWQQEGREVLFSGMFDWKALKKEIQQHGLRNTLFVAQMPTGSTSQILGNTEGTEMITANIYIRRTLSGEFIVVNKYLIRDLIKRGLWNETLKQKLMLHNGNITQINEIPEDLKQRYKTVWETSQKVIIDMAAARSPFVDQSQSMNVYVPNPTVGKISSMHYYAWKQGLKTGMYYLRSNPPRDPIKFTVDVQLQKSEKAGTVQPPEEPNVCLSCGA